MEKQQSVQTEALNKQTLADLIDGKLPWNIVHQIMAGPKDANRLLTYLQILQERVSWYEKILLPLTEHLYIVQKDKERIVKCDCGQEFGSYSQTWKLNALIYVRDTEEKLEEIYRGPRKPDPNKSEIREFYCPRCGTLLEVDAVPPGYPILLNFLPDLETLYKDWLGIAI